MTDELILEPILHENKPYWLSIKHVKTSTTNLNEPVTETIKKNLPLEEKPIFELKKEGLWQCKKCGAISQFLPHDGKPTECYESDGGCGRFSQFKPITTKITGDIQNLWKLTKWQDIPKEDLDMVNIFETMVDLSKKCLIFPDETLYKIYNLWIISTYHINIWESVGWLSFIGLHDSGKTRALDYISELAYRTVHGGSGVSFPAMVRATHYYGSGILLDQAETKMNSNTETGRELLGFILPSYRRRSHYVVAHKEDQQKTISYNNFGFKAFASERTFNPALTSRCIPFHMERDYPEISKLSYLQDDFNLIQTKLLNYKFKFKPPEDLENDFVLKGRIREIFESIIATGKHIGVDVSDIIKYATDMETEKEEELAGTVEYDILKFIKGGEENQKLFDAPEILPFEDICTGIGWDYDKKHAQRLGYIFNKKLILKTKRMNKGTVLLLNESKNARRLKYLYRRYHV